MKAALQIYSRDFDADFFKLPLATQRRIEAQVDRLGLMLDRFSHTHLTGMDCYRLRVGDYRVVYDFNQSKGMLHLLAVGHRREVYRK
ncbi:MAG: type II toxin-antitoxin system RelE/ParE family toxin [Verrucomicrobiota bacterium]